MLNKYPDVLTVKEAREILRIGMNSMYHILQSGELKSIKIGRIYKIKKENVIEYIDRKSKERIKK
ncbi:helix-turn-helix domain-containing protein [Fusobacterium nucleatum]|uniref:helix-turn-helix domain-containing protein n=1 Tax=Fusobacterium nucleatum TaxID=851 RepID=UPI0030D012F3